MKVVNNYARLYKNLTPDQDLKDEEDLVGKSPSKMTD